jgi:amino acid adenylation domain-containing protein
MSAIVGCRRVLLAKRNAPQSLFINALRFANTSYNSMQIPQLTPAPLLPFLEKGLGDEGKTFAIHPIQNTSTLFSLHTLYPMTSYLTPTTPPIAVDFDPFAGGEVLRTAAATEAQREIWASVQMGDRANCAYNESQSLRLQGELNIPALDRALQTLVQRHEALRTTFSPDGSALCILNHTTLALPLIDLTEYQPEQQIQDLQRLRHQAVTTPFNLEQGPLFLAQLIRLQPTEHILILTGHHIVVDGWSWGVMMPELGQFYSAACAGETVELDEADPFSDYAALLIAEAESEETQATEAYWLQQFADQIPVLDFPTDRARPPQRTFDSAREDYVLSAELVSRLKQLGTEFGCSFMTTVLSGFEVFLHRLTGQSDLVVGVPTAGQAAAGQYHLVGHAVNLLPLRSRVDAQQSFADYLQVRRSQVLDAYDHQQFTFGHLVQKLALPRDPSRIPLVPIVFNIDQGLDVDKLPFTGLTVEFSTNPRAAENFELFINATELHGVVTLECQYNTNLFGAETIRRRMAEFETLLNGIIANPDEPIAFLPLLPEAEQRLLNQWNQTQAEIPNLLLHQLVEAQAQCNPEAIALQFDPIYSDVALTYRELDEKANQLAHYLQQLGLQPDTLVGIYIERSLDMMVAVLGILKAGGAYVPLDPAYPSDRLAYMVQDAQLSLIVTQTSLVESLPESAAKIVDLDRDQVAIAQQSTTVPVTSTTPEQRAYIIYTSGSTGKPKGVEIQHRSVVNLLWAMRQQVDMSDVVLSVTTLSFDIAVSELFLPLMVGAKLVIASRAVAMDSRLLMQTMEQAGVTFMQPTPATWRSLLASCWQGNPNIKMVSTGEALPRDLANQLLPKGKSLLNLYGPTETTIWATACPVELDTLITIGHPLANTEAYILDAQLQPVPIGVPGELHIGGAGVAKGYLNRPELTAEKFIPHPFAATERLYKTGDLARFLPEGQIECLGRIDNQIKLRGYRIELGEIESVLSLHPAVKAAAVVLQELVQGEPSLVGYVATDQVDVTSLTTELRQYLKQHLPDFMVPSRLITLADLPLTPNGKIDRQALPKPDQLAAAPYIAPRTALEQQIAEIWAEVLKLPQVSIEDSFFELGGYSLLGIQAIARICRSLQVELSLPTLFEYPTIAELAAQVETIRWAAAGIRSASDVHPEATPEDYEEGEL